ncbi:LysR family transcriptional regulator [Halioxenophilus aromaticivorans]|uniref:LysR substrate-binding domain-containing protein n=1 Tax=Halioxenophilus aromaticivorans TaxID=1306992 RepID=A0AAV3U959_9ALTE
MIEIKRLRFFVQIAQDGSLSKAAETLQMAQPALSRQLNLLEEYLGFPLFIRTGRGMQITREGTLLLNSVAGPLREIELSVENIRSFMSWVEMPVSVGVHPWFGGVLTAPFLQAFETQLPKVNLRLQEGPAPALCDWLTQGKLDFALLDQACVNDVIRQRLVCQGPLMLVGDAKFLENTLGQAHSVNIEQLVNVPLILPCPHNGLRQQLTLAANVSRIELTLQFELDNLTGQLTLAAQQRGLCVLPEPLAQSALVNKSLQARLLEGDDLNFRLYLSSRGVSTVEDSVVGRADRLIENVVAGQFSGD